MDANTLEVPSAEAIVGCRCVRARVLGGEEASTVRLTYTARNRQAIRRCVRCRASQAVDITICAVRSIKGPEAWRKWWRGFDAR